jgi:hypothetical protein
MKWWGIFITIAAVLSVISQNALEAAIRAAAKRFFKTDLEIPKFWTYSGGFVALLFAYLSLADVFDWPRIHLYSSPSIQHSPTTPPPPTAKEVVPATPAPDLRSGTGDQRSALMPCTKGETVTWTPDAIQVKLIAVENSEDVQRFVEDPGGDGRAIQNGIRSGKITKVRSLAYLTLHFREMSSVQLPAEVPFLNASNICERMISVHRTADGEVQIVAPISAGVTPGEGSIMFPRRLVEISPRFLLCIEPSFTLAYPPKSNEYCSKGLYDSIVRGAPSRTVMLVRST